jgi:6-phosphogluconolactonase
MVELKNARPPETHPRTSRTPPALLCASIAPAASGDYFVYIGAYTLRRGKGIYTFRFRPATGKLTALSLAAETPSPAFLAVDPRTGALTFLNKVSCRGEGPALIVVDKTGKALLAANYRSGSLALLPILPDGRLGEATGFAQHHGVGPKPRAEAPHAHGAAFRCHSRRGPPAPLVSSQRPDSI